MTIRWRASSYTPSFPILPASGQVWEDPNTGQTWTYSSGWQNGSSGSTSTDVVIYNPGTEEDPYFAKVSTALRMDGTPGSQVFSDSSPYALTFSAFGSAQISDQYKKSGNGSGFFNGTGSYLTNSVRSAYTFYDKDFTVEGWFRTTSSADDQTLFSIGSYTDGILLRRSTGVDKLYINDVPHDYDISLFPVDTWVHVALTRSAGEVDLWIDGVSCLTFNDTSSVEPEGPMAIAASVGSDYEENFVGYISDFRITLDISRYSESFTPVDSLEGGSAGFNPARLNAEGWWDISDEETVVLSGSKISEWKDKTPNHYDLSQADDSSRPVYLESQINSKPVANWGPNENSIFMSTGSLDEPVAVGEMYCVVKYETTGNEFLDYTGIVNGYSETGWTTLNGTGAYSSEWTPWEYYINGDETSDRATDLFDEIKDTTLLRIKAPAGASAQSNIVIGTDRLYTEDGLGWRGYFCEILLFSSPLNAEQRKQLSDYLRVKWGVRRDAYFSYTSLLLHMDAAEDSNTIVDSSSNSFTITAFGNAALSSESFKFGSSALSLDGADSYIATQSEAEFLLEEEDFTVECWVYASSTNTENGFFEFGADGLRLYINDGSWYLAQTNSVGTEMGAVVTDAWCHLAIARNADTVRMFLDGTQIGSDLDYTGIVLTGDQVKIGACTSSAPSLAGYVFDWIQNDWSVSGDFMPLSSSPIGSFIGKIDEFRVTKAACRYKKDFFVVPSSPFRSS